MTTLRLPTTSDEFGPEDRVIADRVVKRLGAPLDQMSMIWRAQLHWPEHLEANHRQMLYSYRFQGAIPALAKEAMHVAVSMHNRCEF